MRYESQFHVVNWQQSYLVNAKRGIETRLNGGSPKSQAWLQYLSRFELAKSRSSKSSLNAVTPDNPVPKRMSPRQMSGIYLILCLVNKKKYYGESKNVSARLSQHKSKLRRKIHEVSELQSDFDLYGEDNFEFCCIAMSKEFSKEKRQSIEAYYIVESKRLNLCYNKFDKNNRRKENNPFWGHSHSIETRSQIGKSRKENQNLVSNLGCPISLKDKIYPSISAASRETNHSRDTIRRWLNDPTNLNCIYVNSEFHFSDIFKDKPLKNTGLAKPVSIFGIQYPSIAEAARKKDCSRSNIQRLLRESPECFFIET